ncbi:sensor histidine kinase [Streptosporangium sp. V21-05]|uniref:sensor histidine kinase n=1 Tax=Streptosporangium sp. V21-05 TaxID=3446115 RepID=UPI003F52A7E3
MHTDDSRTAWPPPNWVTDPILAAASVAAVVLIGHSRMDTLGWVIVLVFAAVLPLRHRYPVATAVFILVLCAAYYPLSQTDGPIWPALVVALYTVGAEAGMGAAVALLAVALVTFAYAARDSGTPNLAGAAGFLLAGWFAAALAMGAVVRNRRAYLRAAEERRREEGRLRAVRERLRIARELHDALGHNLSLIHVQASSALHRLAEQPELAPDALAAIKQSSKDALRELRATLGVLRQDDAPGTAGPPAGLARLDELAGKARAAGLVVTVRVDGERRPVGPAVDLAAYRIVQESLTNITRHAGATQVAIRVRYDHDEVYVQIDDNGRGRPEDIAGTGSGLRGSGLRGMGERVEALGGRLSTGNRPGGGGFRVIARLPAGPAEPSA